jgi:alkylhydroperoxidase family enzyme
MIRGPASIERTYQDVLAEQPEILAALTAVHEAAWAAVDTDLLELCLVRMAMLLGADDSVRCHSLDNALVADLPGWPASPRFSPVERACLAFTEQYIIDVASIDDGLVADLSDAVGHDEVTSFVNALLVVEQRLRLSLAWGRLLPEVAS